MDVVPRRNAIKISLPDISFENENIDNLNIRLLPTVR